MTVAIAAAALIGLAMTPVDAFARGGHGGHGGHGGGMRMGGGVGHFGGARFGHFGGHARFHGFRSARFAFYPGFYNAYPYYYDDCFLRRRVVATPWGPQVRLVRVCYY
jgi:hypothetical protein